MQLIVHPWAHVLACNLAWVQRQSLHLLVQRLHAQTHGTWTYSFAWSLRVRACVFLCMCVHGDVRTWKHHRQCLWVCVHCCRALGGCRLEHDSACLRVAQSHVCMHAWV